MDQIYNLFKYRSFAVALLLLLSDTALFAQEKKDTILVLPMQMAVPAGAKKVGSIKVGDNATALTCDYEADIKEAKEKAGKMGGNLVKITELTAPAFISKCYRIKADVYYCTTLPAEALAKLAAAKASEADTSSANYATLYIYRLKDSLALEPSYDLYMDKDSVICRVKSRMHKAVKVYKTGNVKLWAKNELGAAINLSIQPGQTYYLRCGLQHGELRLQPFMELMDNTAGAYQYGKLNKANPAGSNAGLEYLRQVH